MLKYLMLIISDCEELVSIVTPVKNWCDSSSAVKNWYQFLTQVKNSLIISDVYRIGKYSSYLIPVTCF